MDTACLRIKFTPLMKNINEGDCKCCLEIVPEVSCLKNLDKIKWKQDDNFFEYIIPMTYKIILKRQDYQKDVNGKNDKQNPVYHSCVDLLHQSTTTDLGSGDVNGIVSDIILRRVTTEAEKCGIVVTQSNGTSNIKNVNHIVTTSVQTIEDVFTVIDHKNTVSIKTNQPKQTLVSINMDHPQNCFHKIIDTVKHLVEKPTTSDDTDSSSHILNNKLISETLKLPENNVVMNLRKLSLSPIFSVDTTDRALKTPLFENFTNWSYLSPYYEIDKNITGYYNSPVDERVLHVFTSKISKNWPMKTATPEERVRRFLQLMNNEILPLKYVLDDILKKYSALNISQELYNKVDSYRQLDRIKRNEITQVFRSPQNRVVHTIVFDG